ncbi:alpha/beta hydrolase [Amnibacterium endophyticum]|uniref:Alpha/beta hydrolase n=1 Tax=Amnibacterium endophyticum TaxID=2109337 RepID=A0ABW4LHN2_9MICO
MRRPVVVVVAAVTAVALVAAAAIASGVLLAARAPGAAPSASVAAPSAWPAPAAIDWGRCDDQDLRAAGAECASVRVPLDWSSPRDGRTIRLAVSRVRHTRTPYEGVMLANPGGPGGSGLGLATRGAAVPRGVGDRYDWIGFDPRGVGASEPRLSCVPDYADGPRPAYDPDLGDRVIAQWRKRSEDYASACGRRGGDLLQHMTTEDSANDMEYLRIALRVPAISFYGYSYGTYLGQVYATLFPDRVKRMVLDSNVDPSEVWYRANLSQDLAFQTALEAWFDWLARYDSRYGLGGTRAAVESSYRDLQRRLAADPADGVFGSAELADTLLYAGYSQSLWPDLGTAFAQAARGDTGLAQRYWRALNETTDDNGYAVYLAVECTDASWPGDWSTWERDTRRVDEKAPFGTWLNTWFNLPCRTWPVKAGTPVEVDGKDVPPILLIGETLDAATPFSGSLAVRARFPAARLLAEPGGTSHAESLNGNACVDGAVADYLADGSLPDRAAGDGPDLTCAPLPVPTP